MVNASPQQSSPALNFLYYVLKPQTDRLPLHRFDFSRRTAPAFSLRNPRESPSLTQCGHFVKTDIKLPFLDCLDTRDNNRLQTTTENPNISTDYWTSHLKSRPLTRLQLSGLRRDYRKYFASRLTANKTRLTT